MTVKTPKPISNPTPPGLAQYQKALHQFLLQRLKSADDVADLAQEVYLRMLRVEDSELVRSPRDYLYGIAAHVVYQFKMRNARDVVTYDSDIVEQAAASPREVQLDEIGERIATEQHLEWALAQLPQTQRLVLLLRKHDRLSHQQIAERLNLSTHTVKKYLFQAQARMRLLWDTAGVNS